MTVRVGVIGVGMIGQDHIRRITQVLTGGTVVAVNDVDAARAGQVAAALPNATVHATASDLIADRNVDAVLIASWGPAHEEQAVAAIEAGKPVFCEKPLAPSQDACLRIIDAELAAGRRLLQVGFMRRYDAGYLAMKAALDDGSIGAPLLMHCAHRNPSVPPYGFTTEPPPPLPTPPWPRCGPASAPWWRCRTTPTSTRRRSNCEDRARPYMFRRIPLNDLPALVADLGYSYIELSPRADFLPFFLHPRASRAQIAGFSRALTAAGVEIASVLPLYRWSGPDEDDKDWVSFLYCARTPFTRAATSRAS